MLSRFSGFFGLSSYRLTAISPERELVVIADIHGRMDLLCRALEQAKGAQVICVGDYVDRGPESAGVLRLLQECPEILCLGGNHEDMLLRFLDDPNDRNTRWFKHGGDTTLESFGIDGREFKADQVAVRDELASVMGKPLIDWLRALPDYFVSGNVAVVHAGADPNLAIELQDSRTLRWGHPQFSKQIRKDGVWVVHGHTIAGEGFVRRGRIAIDTGAYATGRLTFARISKSSVTFEVVDGTES